MISTLSIGLIVNFEVALGEGTFEVVELLFQMFPIRLASTFGI